MVRVGPFTLVMSTKPARLTTTSYALLGAISHAGPCSPYDLKRVLAEQVGVLWEIPHSQVYDEAARLSRAGLLDEQQAGEGRRKLTYTITDDGRRELLRWLRMPNRDRIEVRDVGLLKVAFAAELEPAELRHVAEDHLEQWQALSAELAAGASGPAGAYARALAAAAAAFWQALGEGIAAGEDAAATVAVSAVPEHTTERGSSVAAA